jgi:hypothetical protein
MTGRTCAACDGEIECAPIPVTLDGAQVEACCEACAHALGEAFAARAEDAQ